MPSRFDPIFGELFNNNEEEDTMVDVEINPHWLKEYARKHGGTYARKIEPSGLILHTVKLSKRAMNPFLESLGAAAVTGVGVGLGFRGLDMVLGSRKKNPFPKETAYKIFRASDGKLIFAGNKKDAMREFKRLGGTKAGYRFFLTMSETMPRNPKPHTEVIVSRLPKCDFCSAIALYDGKTRMGPWAYMCPTHFRMYGYGLGLGRGQKLILRKNPREPYPIFAPETKKFSGRMFKLYNVFGFRGAATQTQLELKRSGYRTRIFMVSGGWAIYYRR